MTRAEGQIRKRKSGRSIDDLGIANWTARKSLRQRDSRPAQMPKAELKEMFVTRRFERQPGRTID